VTAQRLLRFTRTERAAHWLLVASFAAILASGTQMPHFNAGQKLNARLSALAFAVLYATGLALLLAGRGLPQGPLHTLTTVALVGLLSGHVFMAVLNPSTRHALRGMTLGDVDRGWAEHHHPRWVESLDRDAPTA
jgi:formate dehydrogenase subunit gamma